MLSFLFVVVSNLLLAAEYSATDRWSAAKSKASEWGAWVEVMFGMILVAELLLPRR